MELIKERTAFLFLVFFIMFVGLSNSAFAQKSQKEQTFEKSVKVGTPYLIYFPKGYNKKDRNTKWPLMMFLHGSGERGNDLSLLKKNGLPMLIDKGKDFPFIVVSPQCPRNEWWSSFVLNALLDDLIQKHQVDTSRIYLTGLSMGGFGTWRMAIEYPKRFAAIAPVCGGGDTYLTKRIIDLPIWAFHGVKDEVVPFQKSEEMVEALKKKGSNVKFTVYPEATHDSWTEAYNTPELYEWFLQQKKK